MGGGTDIREFYMHSSGLVISTAINKYMYITVKKRFEDNFRISYHKTEIVQKVNDIEHPIVREALRLAGITRGIEITSIGDIPGGTGLGSSSSFTVGLLNALFAFKGVLKSAEELAQLACKIEIDILKEPIGKQDQYIAAYGGLKRIRFNPDESVFVDSLIIKPCISKKLKDNLLVFYTGQKRQASSILLEQKNNCRDKIKSLEKLKELASEFNDSIVNDKSLTNVGTLLNNGWLLKKELSKQVSNGDIEKIYQIALKAGALGGKILGAGGGGFLLLYCLKKKQKELRNALRELRELDFDFELEGSKIIYVGGD
jgi:D-glycero-alpha-D-manno-heptose-7-phosphate kinase